MTTTAEKYKHSLMVLRGITGMLTSDGANEVRRGKIRLEAVFPHLDQFEKEFYRLAELLSLKNPKEWVASHEVEGAERRYFRMIGHMWKLWRLNKKMKFTLFYKVLLQNVGGCTELKKSVIRFYWESFRQF